MTTPSPEEFSAVVDQVADQLRAMASERHPSIQQVTRFFEFAHLPAHLQTVSAPFTLTAKTLLDTIPADDPELTVALRKLLEAKDAAVRAAVATR